MQKSFLFLILFSLSTFGSVHTQDFGLRIGLNNTNAKFDFDTDEVDTDGQLNLALGVFLNLPVGGEVFSIQPELTYLNRGYGQEFDFGLGSIETETTISYLDLGALARLNFGADDGLGFYVGVGPYFSYAVSGSVETNGDDQDIDFDADRVNRSSIQLAGAGGVTFNLGIKLFAEVRYMTAVSDLSDLDDREIRPNSLGLHAGVMVPIGG